MGGVILKNLRFSLAPLCRANKRRCASLHRVICSAATPDDSQPNKAVEQQSQASSRGFGKPKKQPLNTADALQQSLQGISDAAGRVSKATNIVLGDTTSEEKWRELDEQVNEYPGQRTFKAIGSGGEDFVKSMKVIVEDVVGTVHEECVNSRLSAKGNYISVTVGPVWVETPEQVLEIYDRMKADGRMRFYL